MRITRCPGRWIFAGFAAGILLIAGCGQGPSKPADAKLPAPGAARSDSKASGSAKLEPTSQKAASAVELKAVKYDQLAAAIQAQRGHVVVMDVWAEY
jgi:hypothetical protein